jgi:activator of HSP90 ATPase
VDGLKIDSVSTFEGDCELGMRKAKFVTNYISAQHDAQEEIRGRS